MSKNTVIISHSSFSGTDLYLSGNGTTYTGSGTPWSVESTSPYELANNPTTGEPYAIKPPEPIPYTVGGPPFGLATIPRWVGYAPVTETFTVQMKGSTKDNAIFLLRQLRNALNAAVSYIGGAPPLLSLKGGTNTAYGRLISATVVEDPRYQYEDTSAITIIRAVVTWTRTAFGGLLSTPTTLINGTSWANAGTGSPDNLEGFGVTTGTAGVGDMAEEGSPMNYTIRPSNDGAIRIRRVLLASVYNRYYVGLSTSNTWSTSSTTYGSGSTISVWTDALSLAGMLGDYRLRMRLIGVVASGHTGTPEFRYAVYNSSGSGLITYSNVIPYLNGDGDNTIRMIDSGPIPITIQELRNLSDMNWTVVLQIRSADGASTTGTLSSVECLLYYDFCDVRLTGFSNWGTQSTNRYDLNISSFGQRSGSPCIPLPYPQAMLTNPSSSNRVWEWAELRGTVPRLYRDSSLWVKLLNIDQSSTPWVISVETARTFTVTAAHAPLYRTVRGGG